MIKRVNSGKAHAVNPEPSPNISGKVQRLDTRCLRSFVIARRPKAYEAISENTAKV